MAANLVSLIMQSLTPDMISKIASTFGLAPDKARTAIGAGVPALLASFANMAAAPGGGEKLSNALAQQSGILDQLMNTPGGGGAKALAEGGSSLLSSLLGGGGLNAIAATVGRFAGIDTNTTKSLLGMLGPIAAGVIGKSSGGFDAKNIASVLSSEAEGIVAAMPPGLAGQLSNLGVLDGIGDGWLKGASSAASTASAKVTDISERVAAGAEEIAQAKPGSSNSWMYWAAGVAALALGWFALGSDDRQGVAETDPTETALLTDRSSVSTPAPNDLAAAVTSSVGGIKYTLQGISDPRTARLAMPKLLKASAQIDTLSRAVSQLDPNARQEISSLVDSSMPALNELCDKVLAMPQAGQVAKPAIDALRTRLQALAQS